MVKQVDLPEYKPRFLTHDAISLEIGTRLWREFGDRIAVEFPSPKTGDQWKLTALGWIGQIPLTPHLRLSLTPKVKLRNLFRMWEYAYALRGFQWLDGIADASSLAEFYERLTQMLARRVLDRGRLGFHRAYMEHVERLPYVRGQIQPRRAWQKPEQVGLVCRYDEHTVDISDNQILAYTLGQIARSRRCKAPAQTAVRRAYHLLQNITTQRSFQPGECVGRSYGRLNQDYQPLHALCRFFLEHTGPTHKRGDYDMPPFLINMARLYELFVAEWLQAHLPVPWHIKSQERVTVGAGDELMFDVDLVLYDGDGRPRAVLDTKYKTPDKPSNDDISQIVTYAKAKGCNEALLIYPAGLKRPLDLTIGDIRLRTLAFTLDGDLEQAGQRFLDALKVTQRHTEKAQRNVESA
ncbi:MAG: restriction endonuclease [Chloroflexi bacterium]|nr:restriction endonuclease [Chloroflexota bacterium]